MIEGENHPFFLKVVAISEKTYTMTKKQRRMKKNFGLDIGS